MHSDFPEARNSERRGLLRRVCLPAHLGAERTRPSPEYIQAWSQLRRTGQKERCGAQGTKPASSSEGLSQRDPSKNMERPHFFERLNMGAPWIGTACAIFPSLCTIKVPISFILRFGRPQTWHQCEGANLLKRYFQVADNGGNHQA